MESFTTDKLRSGARTQAWNEIYSSQLSTTDFIPRDGDFAAGLKLGGLGQLGLARLVTGPCMIRRTDDHIGDRGGGARLYSFLIQLNGKGRFLQGDNEAILHQGDVTLCDNGVPHCYSLGGDAEMMLVRVPGELIHDYLPYPDTLTGRRLPAREGLASTAAGMACSLWKRIEQGFDSAHADSVAHQLLDLFTTSYSLAYGEEMSGPFYDAGLHAKVVSYIEEHIRDPRLNARRAATAAGITTSELLAMFLRRQDSFGGYVARRRLDQAARQLRNPRWRGSTISEIAYDMGYTSVPLFTRSFHARFGVSPGDYRRTDMN
jgi:AraC-like DNA-binding protein